MKVTELAKFLNTSADTVRYYTKIGVLKPYKSQRNGYKYFNESQQHRLQFILTARQLGFTVSDVIAIFKETDNKNSACPLVRDIIEKRFNEVEKKFQHAQQLMTMMNQAMQKWQTLPDKTPDAHSVCHLIESFSQSIATSHT